MYLVSEPKQLTEDQHHMLEGIKSNLYPPGYLRFLQRYGEGTYRGWMNVHMPDAEVLKPFPDYGLWEHDEASPITEQQIGACIAIGTTVDGDFLAVHPQTAQFIWLPRHEEVLKSLSISITMGDEEEEVDWYIEVLEDIYNQVYGSNPADPSYYEPWTDAKRHLFLRLPPEQEPLTLSELADMCREAFHPDQFIQNEYTCKLFYQQLGGYLRFNIANGQEIALIYEQHAQSLLDAMEHWLLLHGCERYA